MCLNVRICLINSCRAAKALFTWNSIWEIEVVSFCFGMIHGVHEE